jgi:hypothetical protein
MSLTLGSVASLLAAILYQEHTDRNHKLWNIVSSETEIYTPYAGAAGMLLQMIRYSRACGSYQYVLDRGLLLTMKLLNQGLLLVKLKSSLRKCYGRHHDLVDKFNKI